MRDPFTIDRYVPQDEWDRWEAERHAENTRARKHRDRRRKRSALQQAEALRRERDSYALALILTAEALDRALKSRRTLATP